MPYSQESQMQMAIAAYKNKKIHSKSKAAAIFGISKTTFLNQPKGTQPQSETHVNGHKLIVF